jgi:hypothetical protein
MKRAVILILLCILGLSGCVVWQSYYVQESLVSYQRAILNMRETNNQQQEVIRNLNSRIEVLESQLSVKPKYPLNTH